MILLSGTAGIKCIFNFDCKNRYKLFLGYQSSRTLAELENTTIVRKCRILGSLFQILFPKITCN